MDEYVHFLRGLFDRIAEPRQAPKGVQDAWPTEGGVAYVWRSLPQITYGGYDEAHQLSNGDSAGSGRHCLPRYRGSAAASGSVFTRSKCSQLSGATPTGRATGASTLGAACLQSRRGTSPAFGSSMRARPELKGARDGYSGDYDSGSAAPMVEADPRGGGAHRAPLAGRRPGSAASRPGSATSQAADPSRALHWIAVQGSSDGATAHHSTLGRPRSPSSPTTHRSAAERPTSAVGARPAPTAVLARPGSAAAVISSGNVRHRVLGTTRHRSEPRLGVADEGHRQRAPTEPRLASHPPSAFATVSYIPSVEGRLRQRELARLRRQLPSGAYDQVASMTHVMDLLKRPRGLTSH